MGSIKAIKSVKIGLALVDDVEALFEKGKSIMQKADA